MGAISIVSSDSQAMGRVGEVITRTWQTAHKMKEQRGPLPEDQAADAMWRSSAEGQANATNVALFNTQTDNFRVKRCVVVVLFLTAYECTVCMYVFNNNSKMYVLVCIELMLLRDVT